MKVKILIALKSFEPKQLPSRYARLQANRSLYGSEVAPFSRALETSKSTRQKTLQSKEKTLNAVSSLVSIALPKKQSNYTVLRSPHIDKKSRDQFVLQAHKRLIIIKTEIQQIRKKLFNLKFHEMPGVQMKVIFQTKTRLSSSSF